MSQGPWIRLTVVFVDRLNTSRVLRAEWIEMTDAQMADRSFMAEQMREQLERRGPGSAVAIAIVLRGQFSECQASAAMGAGVAPLIVVGD